jgi:hypothetical protein
MTKANKKRSKEYPYRKTRRKNAKDSEVPKTTKSNEERVWKEERD